MVVIKSEGIKLFDLLVKNGANQTIKNKEGKTAQQLLTEAGKGNLV